MAHGAKRFEKMKKIIFLPHALCTLRYAAGAKPICVGAAFSREIG
jgi:hypothetical protein